MPMRLEPVLHLGGSYQEIYPHAGDYFTCSGGAIQRLSRDLEIKWSSKPIGAHWIATVEDLDDDGRDEILTSNGRHVFILSANDGNILWSYDVGPPFSYGTYATMFQCEKLILGSRGKQFTVPCFSHKEVLLFDCCEGAERTTLLHKLWMNDAYHPTTTIGDVNNDGKPEIVIARLGGVYVFDPESGRMLSQTQWESDEERRRNYGHFELADIDGDGELEAVIISDRVTRHIAALDNDGSGNFSPLWDRFLEHIYPNDSTELRYTYHSVLKSPKPLIAVSSFNHTIADRWATELIDPITGKNTLTLEGQWLAGVSGERLLLQGATSRAISEFGSLSIADLHGQTLRSYDNAQFAKRARHYRGTRGQFKPEVFGQDDVWEYQGEPIVIQREQAGYRIGDKRLDEPSRVAAVEEEIVFSTASGNLLTSRGASIQLGYHLTTEAHISARPGVEATQHGDMLISPNFSNEVALKTRADVRRIKGRGRIGYDGVYHNVPIFDTPHGSRFALVTDASLDHAQISLFDIAGARVRSYDLEGYPPSNLGFRIGVYDWQYFVHSRGPALYIAAYRSPSMNSECSLAMLLDSGEILWEITNAGEGEFGRGIGPWGSSTLTRVGDKRAVIFCAKDTLIVLDLEIGSFIREPRLLTDFTEGGMIAEGTFKEQGFDTWSTIDDPFTAYGSVIARDINNDGLDEYIVSGCFGGFGVLDQNFNPLWWKVSHFGDVLYRMPAIVNRPEGLVLVQSHSDHSIRAYSVSKGELLSSITLDGVATNITLHADELIATTNYGKLYRLIFESSQLKIIGEIESTASLGSPISLGHDCYIASADGYLYKLHLS
jgi:hypothetical protein